MVAAASLALLFAGTGFRARAAGLHLDLRAPAQAHARARELSQAAYSAHERGDSARALALLDEAEALYPNQADCYNLRGAIHLRRGDYARAASAFGRAAALDPDLWAAKFNLADIPFKQKDYARARVLFDRLVDGTDRYKATTRWELAQYKAGLCGLLVGDETAATRRLSQLVASGATPSAASLHAQAALAFARRDAAAGNRLLLAAQSSCPPAANALYLPSLSAAGWVAPAAAPAGLPPAAVAANTRRGGHSRLSYLPGNLPITEPELPGGAVSDSFAGNALLGTDRGGKPRPAPTPLVLPAARLLPDSPGAAILPEESSASVRGVTSATFADEPMPVRPVPGPKAQPSSPAPAAAPPR